MTWFQPILSWKSGSDPSRIFDGWSLIPAC
jgi:hypothetical protein